MHSRSFFALLVGITAAMSLLTGQSVGAQSGGTTAVPPPTLTVIEITPAPTLIVTSTVVVPPTIALTVVPITDTPTVEVTIVPLTETKKMAGLRFEPAANTVRVGQVFTKTVRLHEILNVGPVAIDMARVGVRFDPNYLQVVGIRSSEAMTVVRASFDNKGGNFTYEAVGEVVLGNIILFTVELEALAVTEDPPFEATEIYPYEVEISYHSERVMTISLIDLVYIVEGPPPPVCHLTGDLDKDGEVDIVDVQTVASQWGQRCAYLPLVVRK